MKAGSRLLPSSVNTVRLFQSPTPPMISLCEVCEKLTLRLLPKKGSGLTPCGYY